MDEDLPKRRIQIDMPPKAMDRLERLKAFTEAASYAEVVREALRRYEIAICVEGGVPVPR